MRCRSKENVCFRSENVIFLRFGIHRTTIERQLPWNGPYVSECVCSVHSHAFEFDDLSKRTDVCRWSRGKRKEETRSMRRCNECAGVIGCKSTDRRAFTPLGCFMHEYLDFRRIICSGITRRHRVAYLLSLLDSKSQKEGHAVTFSERIC